MNKYWKPKVGEIYRVIFTRDRVGEAVIDKIDGNSVSLITLGRGYRLKLGMGIFKHQSTYIEDRLTRLRRACKHYGLKTADQAMDAVEKKS